MILKKIAAEIDAELYINNKHSRLIRCKVNEIKLFAKQVSFKSDLQGIYENKQYQDQLQQVLANSKRLNNNQDSRWLASQRPKCCGNSLVFFDLSPEYSQRLSSVRQEFVEKINELDDGFKTTCI